MSGVQTYEHNNCSINITVYKMYTHAQIQHVKSPDINLYLYELQNTGKRYNISIKLVSFFFFLKYGCIRCLKYTYKSITIHWLLKQC